MTSMKSPSKTALVVDPDNPPALLDPGSRMPPQAERATDPQDGDAFDDFDLRDLADGPVGAGNLLSGLGIADFDILIRDPLGDLLKREPTRETMARDALARPADRALQPTSDILAELSEEFDRVARDPSQLGDRIVWQGLQAAGDEQALTLVQLQHKAEAYRSPHHMMLPSLDINALMEEIGPSDGSTVLDPEARVDVLHLFAGDLLRDMPRAIPSLTRFEHHVMALDSHIDMGGVRTPSDKSS